MVRGLDTFRYYFKDFPDNYIIIGGTACDIIIGGAGFTPRATKDIDLILIVEALSTGFVERFWNFVKDGQYEKAEKNEERKYYRFLKPAKGNFPSQVELFSRIPDLLTVKEGVHLTPIPIDDDLSSLSAILMNEDYYRFTLDHCTQEEGLQRANTEALVCLKAKAYLDMIERKAKGEKVEEKHIKKHKADVFRLSTTLTADAVFDLPNPIKADMQSFIAAVENDLPAQAVYKEMGLSNISPEAPFRQLVESFQLG